MIKGAKVREGGVPTAGHRGTGSHPFWLGCKCALFFWCCAALSGCGEPGARIALEGTVTLDEEPLATGAIEFFPLPGTKGPTAGGSISDGHFYIAPEGGTMEGTFRVKISARRKTGKKISDPTAEMMGATGEDAMIDEYKQYLPARYNKRSQLTAEVTADGLNEFEFPLTTKR